MVPDKQDGSFEPGDGWRERRREADPQLEAALDQLSARMERLKRQAENLAAAIKPKRK